MPKRLADLGGVECIHMILVIFEVNSIGRTL